ncbi:hypothetical protein HJC23_013009 [Cyclotella cryptica]|uniref:Uncharacterized protein n=1 Tax=Cyclotella cryptica TaxID=29204 RepID=A0ABD3QFW7_9STRA|eukprot:CCRYP_005615-RA/>CCRYP_005615-RA protein AED:0.35 eAED:0.35 QI:0/-1/0/1/-1/1/1/0/131
MLDVLHNWLPHDPTPHYKLYQGLCIFDYLTEFHKANNYWEKELPFLIWNDLTMARTVKQCNDAKYMKKLLMGKEDTNWRTEYSPNNHFMYWVDKWSKEARKAQWKELRERREWGGEVHDRFGWGDQEELAK